MIINFISFQRWSIFGTQEQKYKIQEKKLRNIAQNNWTRSLRVRNHDVTGNYSIFLNLTNIEIGCNGTFG